MQARRTGDATTEKALEGVWQIKLQDVLRAHPALAWRLQDILDHVLVPALLSPREEAEPGNGHGEETGSGDPLAVRTAVIGQAAAGLTAAAAIIYGSGALTIALRLYFTHLSWETVLGQLPRDLILTTGFGQIILPAMIIGILGAVLLNFLVNGNHSGITRRVQLGLQSYLTGKPSVGHFAVWLFTSAIFGVLEPLISLYFYNSHAHSYFSPAVVIPAFDAMAAAAVLSAFAVGIALILLPAPTMDGLRCGLSAPRRGKTKVSAYDGAGEGQAKQAWIAWRIAEPVRRVFARPAREPARPSPLGTLAWMVWVGAVVGFAVIPGVATFAAVALFPASNACSAEFTNGMLAGNLIGTNAGWAYMVEYKRSQPGQDYIAVVPLSSLRLETIGRFGTCVVLAPGPGSPSPSATATPGHPATPSPTAAPGRPATPSPTAGPSR